MITRGFFILVMAAALNGCSLYQSDGRKALEKNAAALSAAQANFMGCQNETLDSDWLRIARTDSADVYASEKVEFALRVQPRSTGSSFSCAYQFSSAQEMTERMDSAIEISLSELGQSLGSIAFPTDSPLK